MFMYKLECILNLINSTKFVAWIPIVYFFFFLPSLCEGQFQCIFSAVCGIFKMPTFLSQGLFLIVITDNAYLDRPHNECLFIVEKLIYIDDADKLWHCRHSIVNYIQFPRGKWVYCCKHCCITSPLTLFKIQFCCHLKNNFN